MSESSESRRMAAEIRFDSDRAGIDQVGDHSIHHYWHLLAPHFRDVLMSPQRRFDDGGVAWNWRESGESKPANVSELGAVRKKLTAANRAFAEGLSDADDSSEGNALSTLQQVRERMNQMTAVLTAKPDVDLRAFVGRTESGPMLHSWGAASPAQPYNPEARECEISGAVIVGEERAAGYEVVLENRKGLRVARQVSGGEGCFCFSKIGPGEYRVRVVSDRVRFSLSGLTITIERSSMTNLELRSTSSPDAPPIQEPPTAETAGKNEAVANEKVEMNNRKSRKGRFALVGLLLFLAMSGSYYVRKQRQASSTSAESSRNSSITSVRPATENTLQKNSVSSGDALSKNLGDAGDFPNEGLKRDRTAVSAHSRESSREHTKAADVDHFDLPSDTAPAAKPEAIRAPPRPTAGDSSSASSQGAATEGGLDAGREARTEGVGNTGQALTDQATQTASSAINGNPPAGGRKKSNGSVAASRGAKSENDASLKTPASESEEAKPTPPAPPTPSPVLVVPPPAKVQSVETPSVPPDAAKEKEKSLSEPKDTAAAVSADKAKPVVSPRAKPVVPPPKSDAEKSMPEQANDGSANPAEKPQPPAPKPKPAATASVPSSANENSGTSANAANFPSPTPAAATTSAPSENPAATSTESTPSITSRNAAAHPTANISNPKPQNSNPERSVAEGERATTAGVPITAVEASPPNEVARETFSMRSTARLSSWELRLTDDSILPTQPLRIGEEDTAEAMRVQLLQQRKKQLPETLAHPVVNSGYAIDLPAGSGKVRWHAVSEAPGIETTLTGNRAEISWPGQLRLKESEYRLSREDGSELATFRVDEKGNGLMKTATTVRRHFWLEIERAPADRAKVTDTEWADRFAWVRLPGSSVQTSWHRDLRWLAGKSDRIDFGEDAPNGQPSLVWLAYVDHATGWTLSSEVEQTNIGSEL